jgi:act minimal PKS acyl carrier protein
MSQLTMEQLKDLLRTSAGEAEATSLGQDISQTSFNELGYDSLALIETAALIKRSFGVDVTDDIVEIETPSALVDFVNAKLTAA